MSARPDLVPRYRPMRDTDLEAVARIEADIHAHPWSRGNFDDSLRAGYCAWVLEAAGEVAGYGVVMMGVEEAHLLNLSVARAWQRRGHGRALLGFFLARAREMGARAMFLEVRPSNAAARTLYAQEGFHEISVRRQYYPAPGGREDAIVMGLDLPEPAP